MRARFHDEPIVRATDLLLQERTPRDVAVARPPAEDLMTIGDAREFVPPVVRRFTTPHAALPRTNILSNGRYAVMVTAAGSGYSRWRDIAVTRWKEDVTLDVGGTYVYLRDVQNGQTWSAGYQPTGREPDSYEAVFSEDRARIVRRRRLDEHHPRRARLPRRRRRGAPCLRPQSRDAYPGRRADVVCRDRARARRRRCRPSRVLEPLRPDGVCARARRGARDAPAAIGRRAAALAGPRGVRGRRNRRCPPVGNRPRPVPRPRARGPETPRAVRGSGRSPTPWVPCWTPS